MTSLHLAQQCHVHATHDDLAQQMLQKVMNLAPCGVIYFDRFMNQVRESGQERYLCLSPAATAFTLKQAAVGKHGTHVST